MRKGNRSFPDHNGLQNYLNRAIRDMYGYKCEYCSGTVRKRLIDREAFKHRKGFVILENVLSKIDHAFR